MKIDIKQVGLWWKWNEYCNNCGRQIRDDSFSSSAKPDEDKPDNCLECLNKMLDEIVDKNR